MKERRIPYALAALLLVPSPTAARQDAREENPSRQLFLDNCARCHGETGAGDGWTELDRPARSFEDGGFSFGNTPEALFRTISVGIPGTPMPGFDISLSPEQRRLLADYVVTLGPPVTEVEVADTIMAVTDRPLVVRGMLPPIAEGAVTHPRGLLLGTTDGFTFEYRADDVRLLGVRQGGFVRRTDWTGRGGTGLDPLGKVVQLIEGGLPGASFTDESGAVPLQANLTGSWIRGPEVGLAYALHDGEGRLCAKVEESCRTVVTSVGTGFARRFDVRGADTKRTIALRGVPATRWAVRGTVSGLLELSFTTDAGAGPLLEVGPGSATTVEVNHFLLTEWTDEIATKLFAEVQR